MTQERDPHLDDTLRDISAARADIEGKRDHTMQEFQEKLHALERLEADLNSGDVSIRVAQSRVRKLTAERAGAARAGMTQAGRTMIGMTAPITPGTPPQTSGNRTAALRDEVSAAKVHALLIRVLRQADHLLVGIVDGHKIGARERIHAALLLSVRRALSAHVQAAPEDVVLREGLHEYLGYAERVLDAFEKGGVVLVMLCAEYLAQRASQWRALGGDPGDLRKKLRGFADETWDATRTSWVEEQLEQAANVIFAGIRALGGEGDKWLDALLSHTDDRA